MGEAKRKKEQFRSQPKVCVFCGERRATTRDHVPPKCLFTSPRPRLVTVPACELCNQRRSQSEEEFKAKLGLLISPTTPEAKDFWQNGALPTIKANRRMLRDLASGPRVMVRDETGSLAETRAFRWSSESHDTTIAKLARGLYWHHFSEIVPEAVEVSTMFFEGLDEEMVRAFDFMTKRNIGGDRRFVYGFARAEDDPLYSAWIFQFYESHWAGAFMAPKGETPPGARVASR